MPADDREPGGGGDLTRRDLIRLGAAATISASLGVESLGAQTASPTAAPPRTFFTPQ